MIEFTNLELELERLQGNLSSLKVSIEKIKFFFKQTLENSENLQDMIEQLECAVDLQIEEINNG